MASVVGDDHPHVHDGHTDTHKTHTRHTQDTQTQQSTVTTTTDNNNNEKRRRATTTIIIAIIVVATRHVGSIQTVLFVVLRNDLCSGTTDQIEFR